MSDCWCLALVAASQTHIVQCLNIWLIHSMWWIRSLSFSVLDQLSQLCQLSFFLSLLKWTWNRTGTWFKLLTSLSETSSLHASYYFHSGQKDDQEHQPTKSSLGSLYWMLLMKMNKCSWWMKSSLTQTSQMKQVAMRMTLVSVILTWAFKTEDSWRLCNYGVCQV